MVATTEAINGVFILPVLKSQTMSFKKVLRKKERTKWNGKLQETVYEKH
jgi:hypothetical protein